jgi:hypothetical protein
MLPFCFYAAKSVESLVVNTPTGVRPRDRCSIQQAAY